MLGAIELMLFTLKGTKKGNEQTIVFPSVGFATRVIMMFRDRVVLV